MLKSVRINMIIFKIIPKNIEANLRGANYLNIGKSISKGNVPNFSFI